MTPITVKNYSDISQKNELKRNYRVLFKKCVCLKIRINQMNLQNCKTTYGNEITKLSKNPTTHQIKLQNQVTTAQHLLLSPKSLCYRTK